MSGPINLADLISRAEQFAKELEARGATYLYDGVYVYHDGFQYWLCTETGNEVALEPRTMSRLKDYLKGKGETL